MTSDVTHHLAPSDGWAEDYERRALSSLSGWLRAAEQHWMQPGEGALGWYGSGYNGWGVQTNQKYVSAAAALAHAGPGAVRELAIERALAALRFTLQSHRANGGRCSDGTAWGHTWISSLGIERMMFAIPLLEAVLTDQDRKQLEQMLVSEATWLTEHYHRGSSAGIGAGRWHTSGRNAPESNLWNGALLWRTATTYLDHPDAERWRERALKFLINGVSIPSDRDRQDLIDGAPVAQRHIGANFFESFALDHHGYLNVGYMAICASQAAILHFDQLAAGRPAPEALHWHQEELWRVLRTMIAPDGRLLRIGGDSRVRYAYCQEYLLPSALYALDQFGDPFAREILGAQLGLIETELSDSPSGYFYDPRLAHLARLRPYYYTRLETDRANVLAMTAVHLHRVGAREHTRPGDGGEIIEVGSRWSDDEHGAVLVRGPQRFASFAWRANGLAQGLCIPTRRSDMAEWEQNLSPRVHLEGDPAQQSEFGTGVLSRQYGTSWQTEFPGGFATAGTVLEGVELKIAEGWQGGPGASTVIAFVALPDDRTVVGFQLTTAAPWHVGVLSLKGVHLGVPNDVYNGGSRMLRYGQEERVLTAGSADLDGQPLGEWVTIDGVLGVVSLDGQSLSLDRSAHRRGGPLGSLYVDTIVSTRTESPFYARPGQVLIDSSWAVLAGAGPVETSAFAARVAADGGTRLFSTVRIVEVAGADGNYLVMANLGPDPVGVPRPEAATPYLDVSTGNPLPAECTIEANQVVLGRR